ncbi:MAG: KamA family radical SAM protein [DPANN group archaeon]|nr:KamA family radical SAM protein [DPANN group archaeon]
MVNKSLDTAIEEYVPRSVRIQEPIRKLETLREMGFRGLDDLIDLIAKEHIQFPILTNAHYASLLDKDDPEDPLRKIVIPTEEEILRYVRRQGQFDTSGERTNTQAPGLQHKYAPTAIALVNALCASYCRFCFRKRIFMGDEEFYSTGRFPNKEAIRYLQDHREINTLLLTGGDAFMLDNDTVRSLTGILSDPSLDHIRTVRFGTRMVVYQPQRIDDELGQILQDFRDTTGKRVMVGTHVNHPREVTPETKDAFEHLLDHKIALYNQTVLLKGINDDPAVLYELFDKKLAFNDNRPYYLFHDRPVSGSEHMQVRLDDGLHIYSEVAKRMTGPHKPRYVMSTKGGKMEIDSMHPTKPNVIILKYHSAKDMSLTGKAVFYDLRENNPFWYEPTVA